MICSNIELDLDVLGTGRLAAASVPAGLSGSTFALGNAVEAAGADVGVGLTAPQEGDVTLPFVLPEEVGNAVDDEDAGGSEGLGSMNEKKLCERECLWWCPRRAEGPLDDWLEVVLLIGVLSSPPELGGSFPPNVKPSPSRFGGGGVTEKVVDCGVVLLCPLLELRYANDAECGLGIIVTGASTSCAPSSAMEGVWFAPGLGK
jgi:hypothetical protein